MDPKYFKDDLSSILAHTAEECGEVVAAIGKTQRFGLDSYNPKLAPEDRVTNKQWLLSELADLKMQISRLEASLLKS